MENRGDIVIYTTNDGLVNLNVNLIDENIWLNMDQISVLYDKAKSTISEHIQHIFEDGELVEDSVVRNFRTTATDGKNYNVNHYNLDMILAIGYRVRSKRGVQFRIWATNIKSDMIDEMCYNN